MNAPSSFIKLVGKSFLVLSFLAGIQGAKAQVNISSLSPYSQNFDALPQSGTFTDNATLPGWYVALTGAKTITGSDGNNAATGIRSFGNTGETDRALGGVTSTTTGTISYGIRFKNTTGSTISQLIVSYTLEEWRGLSFWNFANASMNFSYRKSASETSLIATSPAWTTVTALSISGSANGGWAAGALDGNENKTMVTAAIPVSLANGQEIMLRWQNPAVNSGNYLALDDISVTPIAGNTNVYYNIFATSWIGTVTLNNITQVANWNTSPDGSGTSAASFSNGIFIFDPKGTSYTLPANLAIGTGAKLIVTGAGELIVPNNSSQKLTGLVDVNDNATLTLENATLPTLGTLGDLSTVNFNSASDIPNVDFGNLQIGNGNKKLKANTRVKKKLRLNTKLDLDNFDLTLEEGATIDNASAVNYVIAKGNGRLKLKVKNNSQEVLFPVGTATEYLPVTLTQNNAATADVFSVKVIDGVYASYTNNVPVGQALTENAFGKTWIVNEAVSGGSNLTIAFEVKTTLVGGLLNVIGSLTGFDVSQAKIVHYENNQWDYAASLPTLLSAITGGYTLTRSGITSFSPFSMMSGNPQPLPVELVSFTAKRAENGIVCHWKTAQELNNDFFTVERSNDGQTFSEIGKLKGKGTTSQAFTYSFTDLAAPTEMSYYRLKQTDFDGTTTFSKIVVVSAAATAAPVFELYPNPSAGQAVLQVAAAFTGTVQVSILNPQGQLIKELAMEASALKNGTGIDLTSEANGVYILKIVTGNQVSMLRMVKQ
ncbi:T9SS type A sorting domain-containing protein [Adhaeribacter sp. BT258]|uniref:T9SS type A sorting domain-containing protein n=1 Tax=Adhaeribacter terrigena TaxID=2793070 RepID=A0ABS1C1P2_9BACT|nr:T9SS type A sorting domain-containing protein [Adhaeribacter terrigena]MBK0403306.1 T9SS type A sorting domain-containing protein [Adhaeribacter terrigena]